MKVITKAELKILIDRGVLKNTHNGVINTNGDTVGYRKSVHKRYIEDRYVEIAKKLGA